MEEMILETQGRDDFGDGYLRICVDPLPKEETITGENDDKKKVYEFQEILTMVYRR